jgi:hypothetical protein
MFEQFRQWYLRNYLKITWFLIGFLIMAGLAEFAKGDWGDALVYWVFAAINYWWDRGR